MNAVITIGDKLYIGCAKCRQVSIMRAVMATPYEDLYDWKRDGEKEKVRLLKNGEISPFFQLRCKGVSQ